MRIAIIGAGINGVCSAIMLAERGCKVTVYDRGTPFGETSSRSSKMLHGGIRYLESYYFRSVRDALSDRAEWLKHAAEHTQVRRFYIPIYGSGPRCRLKLYAGVKLYEWLSGGYSLGPSRYHGRDETLSVNPTLCADGLLGSVSYVDVQMDDMALSNWLLCKAHALGVEVKSQRAVEWISPDGRVNLGLGEELRFDVVVNACGPWTSKLLEDSGIKSRYRLMLIKGSHIFVERTLENPLVIQMAEDGRIVFALPVGQRTLIGTTEVKQELSDSIVCSQGEKDYLLGAASTVFEEALTATEVSGSYAGLRPIVIGDGHTIDPGSASRDSSVEVIGSLINVFGGKWTSGMRLGRSVAEQVFMYRENNPC